MSDDHLFAKADSPLGKFDAYMTKLGRTSHAAATEKDLPIRRTAGVDWAGYCHAWAMASLLTPEPVAREVSGVKFSVGDLKALLIKSHDSYAGARRYGEPTIEDVSPKDFHHLVQAELFGKKRGFIIDHDSGEPVWNVPIYGADFTRMERDERDAKVVHVTLSFLAASSQVYVKQGNKLVPNYEYVGTEPTNFIYTYDLQGEWTAEGGFEVHTGTWSGSSATEHPDFMLVLSPQAKRGSDNDQIQPEVVDQILGVANHTEGRAVD